MASKIIAVNDAVFRARFSALLSHKLEMDETIQGRVSAIMARIRGEGDAALVALTNQFDRRQVEHAQALAIPPAEWKSAHQACDAETIAALEIAADRIRSYHKKQMPADIMYTDDHGIHLGNIWKPIHTAGIYVPGGLASYPSSVLMNAIPAKVAGVKKIVMAVPAPEGRLNPLVLAAAHISGVDEIYTIGGAQAVAALAYGTETIPKVDVIAGPGNAYVAAAKRLVYGMVGIDMIAGPSEILVVADAANRADWMAADLLSQAEHDVAARAILITDDREFAVKVEEAVQALLPTLAREQIARQSWEENGMIIVVEHLEDALPLIDEIAPEHLELAFDQAESWVAAIHNAGAIFTGRHTPEAIGDYIAGPSHVLPTAGTARFSSGLSVYTFLKRVSVIGCSANSLSSVAPAAVRLANEEGLGAHALSVTIRQ